MPGSPWTAEQLTGFLDAAQSLKLYRRAELQREGTGTSLIESLYVDPLPYDHVFKTTLKPNTTFLIGRKGTGKSTVFQRVQHELRKRGTHASAYIDIKTIYETSQVDPSILAKLDMSPIALDRASLEKYLLYKAFLRCVISEIQTELRDRVKGSWWTRIKRSFSGSLDELFEGLDNLIADADAAEFVSVSAVRDIAGKFRNDSASRGSTEATLSATLGGQPDLKATLGTTDSRETSSSQELGYADVLMRAFNIKEYILRLKDLLNTISVKYLYVFVDDFSELPEEAMMIVVDTVLAPLNNWSDELIKFKVAAYPGRIYYGQIDKTKIDEIYLDLYKLYGSTDVSGMEEKAIDFTRRLVDRRLQCYCKCDSAVFIEAKGEDIWRLLFYATMANPRILGYLLYYLHESHLIYGNSIGAKAIRDAARKYYEEKIEPYFAMNKFLHESFDERSSVFSLKELLEAIVVRARELRGHRESAVLRGLPGRPPTSHFHVVSVMEGLLSTLALNFFLTKYYEMSDRDGRKVSVFALNYGLCQKHTIEFGRPSGKREYRLYFIERRFDYSPILENYLKTNQEIACSNCGARFDVDALPALQLYGMTCPKCRRGTCVVTNLSKKYEAALKAIEPNLLLPRAELGILQTLNAEQRALHAADIAGELDCSYQLVGKRGKILSERGLVDRSENEQGRRQFRITKLAETNYFETLPSDVLDVGGDEQENS